MNDLEEFSVMLKDSAIEDDLKEILPSFRGGKKRLEIDAIKKIFDDENLDTDEPQNDFDVWLALKNRKKRSDVLYVLKDCLKEFNITCDDAKLNKLKKDQFIELFFNVFDIYPKADAEVNATVNQEASTPEDSANSEEFDTFKEKIFPNGIDKKQEIEYAAIADMLPEKFSSVADLKQFMLTTKAGNKVKELFKFCCQTKNIAFNAGKLGGLERKIYVPIFFDVFDIKFPQSTKLETAPVTEGNATPPNSNLHNVDISLTFERVQEIYNAGEKISVADLEGYDICDNVTVYRDLPITLSDGFWIKIPDDVNISRLCTAIINAQSNEIVAIGSVENYFVNANEIRPHLIFDADKIKFEHFESQREFEVMLIPGEAESFLVEPTGDYRGKLYIFECDLNLDTLQET